MSGLDCRSDSVCEKNVQRVLARCLLLPKAQLVPPSLYLLSYVELKPVVPPSLYLLSYMELKSGETYDLLKRMPRAPAAFSLLPPSGCCLSSLASSCRLCELLHLELTILFMLLLKNLSKLEPDVEPARCRRRALAEQRSLVCDLKRGDHFSNEAARRAWRARRRRPAAVPFVKLPAEMVLPSIVHAIGLASL